MFEFVIIKSKSLQYGLPENFDFINVPKSFNKKLVISVENNLKIFFLYFDNKKTNDFFYENEEFIYLLRGSIITSEKISFTEMVKMGIIDNEESIKKLRGHFNIIIINKKNSSVKLINDLFGLKPVYYGNDSKFNFISSSLFVLKKFDLIFDKSSFIEKIIFQHNILDNTYYRNVKVLQEGVILNLKSSFASKTYFNWIDYFTNASDKKKFSYEEYRILFNNKIKYSTDSNDINLVTFTGGHDGRAVVSGLINNKIKFETFSFGRKGSENTKIPEVTASNCKFSHSSVYLHNDYEKEYSENGFLTSWISDGELPFTQQTTLFAIKKFSKNHKRVFTGLLAGEILGPIHLKTDYINPVYFNSIIEMKKFDYIPDFLKISDNEKSQVISDINNRIEIRRKNLSPLRSSKNAHLLFLADMITWGFRKFYAYQMHLMRYHLENNPVFYDFDLVNLLINSNYNKIYKNSYKSLYHRRNARKIQLYIINKNSFCLANQNIDRGYTPKEAFSSIYLIPKLIKYFKRKRRISMGKYVPDFLNSEWTSLIKSNIAKLKHTNDFEKSLIDSLNQESNYELTQSDIILLTNIFFLNNYK